VSAPGKVLLTGGYLVTVRPNQGLVFSVDARCYALVESFRNSATAAADAISPASVEIRVTSPQFRDSARVYRYRLGETSTLSPSHNNPFVETVLLQTLTLVARHPQLPKHFAQFFSSAGNGLNVIILADNPFYSQLEHIKPGSGISPAELPRFKESSATLENMKKTGLGSSAALTTSLVGALLRHFGLPQEDLTFCHRLAQYCHCLAQNSIGSGFDVSAAVYGSQVYGRFSPALLRLPTYEKARAGLADVTDLFAVLRQPWDDTHVPAALPGGLSLLLGDINEGSKTPGMVAKVNAWRNKLSAEEREGSAWGRLSRRNAAFAAVFAELCAFAKEHKSSYKQAISQVENSTHTQWTALAAATGRSDVSTGPARALTLLARLRETFLAIRTDLCAMGRAAAAAAGEAEPVESFIEPASQTALADATAELPGVLFAGVPGAGGKDAICAVVAGVGARRRVEELWARRQVLSLGVQEQPAGLQTHPLTAVPRQLLQRYLVQRSSLATAAL
jgi:phosphomevalonate kinase